MSYILFDAGNNRLRGATVIGFADELPATPAGGIVKAVLKKNDQPIRT